MQDMMQDSHSSRADACAARKTNDCRCERWPGMQDQRFFDFVEDAGERAWSEAHGPV